MSFLSGTLGAVMSANEQSDATDAQREAAAAARSDTMKMYDQSRADFKPFLEPSSRAMATLQSGVYGQPQQYKDANGVTQTANYQPTESAGFQYTKNRTLEDLGRQLRMMGRGSGTVAANATGRTLGDLNAANDNTYKNDLLNLVKTGQGTANSAGTLSQNTGNSLSSLALAQGNAIAQGSMNKANLYAGLGQQSANGAGSAYQGYKFGQGQGWWGQGAGAGAGAAAGDTAVSAEVADNAGYFF